MKNRRAFGRREVQHYYKLIASLSEYTTNPANAMQLLNIISPILYRARREGMENMQKKKKTRSKFKYSRKAYNQE